MDIDVIKSYLVSLGFQVEHNELRKFEDAMRKVTNLVQQSTFGVGGIASTFLKAGTAVAGVLTGIATGAVGLMDNIAGADLEFQVFARRMFMSTNAAKSLKIATDALGYSLEDIIWGPKELQERFHALIVDQKRLQEMLGPNFEANMRRIRDVTFQFTRLGVNLKYLGMGVASDLSKALFGDEDSLERKLTAFNNYLIQHLPEISKEISEKLVPIVEDMGQVAKDLFLIMSNINWTKTADDLAYLSGKLKQFFDFLAENPIAQKVLLGAMAGGAAGSVIPGVGTGMGALVGGAGGLAKGLADESIAGKDSRESAGYGPFKIAADWLNRMLGLPVGSSALAPIMNGTATRENIQQMIVRMAKQMGVDPALAEAVAKQESGFNPRALNSSSGAMGLFQLMPGTAKQLGVNDPFDPSQNAMGGLQYLRDLMKKYNGDINKTLKEYGGFVTADPTGYINSVTAEMGRYRRAGGSGDGGVNIDTVTIHVDKPNASPEEIQKAVAKGIKEEMDKRTQRNLLQYQGAY